MNKEGKKLICIRIKAGKYRYRGHIIYSVNKHCWWCCPDPSDQQVSHKTLRSSKQYIDEWETAFNEKRVCGNIIGISPHTLSELETSMKAISEQLRGRYYPSLDKLIGIFDDL